MAKRKSKAAPIGPDGDMIERVKRCYAKARDHSSNWRKEAREDFRFYAGDQWKDEERAVLEEQQRPPVVFNRAAVFIDAVSGYEVNNRQEIKFYPREQGDVGPSEVLTNAVQWVYDNTDGEDEESDAFRDAAIAGMGWTERRLDDSDNPEYDIKIDRIDPLEMWWDPGAKKPNLADANWLMRVRKWSRAEAEDQWPGKLPAVSAFEGWEDAFDENDTIDDKRHPYKRDETATGKADRDGFVTVVEYQWREHEAGWLVVNPSSGKAETADADLYAALKAKHDAAMEQAAAQGAPLPPLQAAKRRLVVYRRAFLCGDTVLEQGPSPIKHGFTYRCVTGKRDRATNTWFGLMRSLKDPQRWSNKWLSQAMHLFNLQAKGGIMAERDAFDDAQQAEQDWADPSKIVWVRNGALSAGRVQPRQFGDIPPSLPNLLKYANDSFGAVSGINAEAMGMADREQAGVLEYQRKQSAITMLAPLFDSLRRYRKIVGRDMLYMVQTYISDGRLVRIVGDAGAKYVPLTKDATIGEYDVIVDQSASSPNVKEATWSVLQQLMPAVMKMGVPMPALLEMLGYSPLPDSLVSKLKQMMAEQAQQPPPPDPEAMKAKAQIEAKQQELALKQREAEMSLAMKAQEHQQDMAFKRAAAEQDAALQRAKAEQEMAVAHQRTQAELAMNAQKSEHELQYGQRKAEAEMAMRERMGAADMARRDGESEARRKPPEANGHDGDGVMPMALLALAKALGSDTVLETDPATGARRARKVPRADA